MQKFLFSTARDFIIGQTSNFTKDNLFGRYFAEILIRSTEQLFRRRQLDDNSENIKICNSLLQLIYIVCLVLFLIDTK